MKKRFGIFLIILSLYFSIAVPGNILWAASGGTTVSVSSKSIDIGANVTVTVKASGSSGEKAVATMTVSYDASVLQFVSCSTTYGGGGNSVTATSDSFSVTLKAISAGSSKISVSGSDGVVFDTNEELESISGSSTSITVNNNAATEPNGGNTGGNTSGGGGSAGGSTSGGGGNTGGNTNGGGGNAGGNTVGGITQGGGNQASTGDTDNPPAKLSADNSLKVLTISPGTLSPSFTGSNTKYSATVANNVTSIAVTAAPANSKAVVESVSGHDSLVVGNNTLKIVVKAENGVTATYTINVTRQGAAEEKPKETEAENKNPDANIPGTETEVETETEAEEGVTESEGILIGNTSYQIAEAFSAEQIPKDFVEKTINYHGADYKGVGFEKGAVSMLYFLPENASVEEGKFFIYDAARDALYPFVKLSSRDNYVIALLAPVDFVLPGDYVQTQIMADGISNITAYQKAQEQETELVYDFYLFYGVNQDGTEGWYQYDALEGTYQRTVASVWKESAETMMGLDDDNQQYEALLEKYKKEKSSARTMISVLVFIAAVLFIVLINLLIRLWKGSDNLPGGGRHFGMGSSSKEDALEQRRTEKRNKHNSFRKAIPKYEEEEAVEEKDGIDEEPWEDDEWSDEEWEGAEPFEEEASPKRKERPLFFTAGSTRKQQKTRVEKKKSILGDPSEDILEEEFAESGRETAQENRSGSEIENSKIPGEMQVRGKKENIGDSKREEEIEVLDLNDL